MTLLAIQEVVLGQEAGHPEENVAGPDHAPEVRAAHLPGGDLTPSLRRGPPAPTHPDAQDPVLAHKPFFFSSFYYATYIVMSVDTVTSPSF